MIDNPRSLINLIYKSVVGIKSNTIPKPNSKAIPSNDGSKTPSLNKMNAPPYQMKLTISD
jgi:hypothetical protein